MLRNKLGLTILLISSFAMNVSYATPLTAREIVQQFNAVVLNNDTSQSHVDGRTWVGGNLTGGDYVQHSSTTPNSTYNGLTVKGNASNVNVNGLGATVGGNLSSSNINAGQSYIAGNVSNSNLNGGKSAIGGTKTNSNQNGGSFSDPASELSIASIIASSTDFTKTLSDLSTNLSILQATGGTIVSNGYGKTTFNVTPDSSGVAVFNLTGALNSLVFSSNEFQFNLNGATSLLINSDATTVSMFANFLGGQAQSLAAMTLWNFYDATNITLSSQFGGSILATDATLTNYQNIEGGVYVNNLNQYGEIHQAANTSAFINSLPNASSTLAVPEPSTYLIFITGLLLMLYISKSRIKKTLH